MNINFNKLSCLLSEAVIALKQTGLNVSLAADLEKMKPACEAAAIREDNSQPVARIEELEKKEPWSERQSVIDGLARAGESWADIEEYMEKWDAEHCKAMKKQRDNELRINQELMLEPISQRYKLVPVEPTPEMIAAAMNCDDVQFNDDDTFCVNFGNIYAAMLAAAPGEKPKC
ncbi:TPA: hypothetical protein ACXNDR_003056 [Serratia marcescens]